MEGQRGIGDYALVERLAVRATSECFLVEVSTDAGVGRRIVLKRLRSDAHAAAFVDDAKVQANLTHPKIVRALEHGQIGDAPYVALEYVEGIDLLGLLGELARHARTVDPVVAAWIARETLDGLDYAHTLAAPSPIIHGRLSPTKVLLGVGGEVKLCDFGVSRSLELGPARTQEYGHMSPEQVMDLPVDARGDLFVVGILLAEMLIGRRLFAASNEFDVLLMVRDVQLARFDARASRIDDGLVTIVQQALERHPDRRWPTAAAFRDALDAWLGAHQAREPQRQLETLVGELRAAIEIWRRSDSATTPEFDDDSRAAVELIAPNRKQEEVPAPKAPTMRTIAIPPRSHTPPRGSPLARSQEARPARGGAGGHLVVAKDDAPVEVRREPVEELRAQARGTVGPKTEVVETRHARGTVEPATTGEAEADDAELALDRRPTIRRPPSVDRAAAPTPRVEPATSEVREPLSTERVEPRTSEAPAAEPTKVGQAWRSSTRGALHPQRSRAAGKLDDVLPARTPTPDITVRPRTLSPADLAKQGQSISAKLANLDPVRGEGGAFAQASPLLVLFRLMSTKATGLLSAARQGVRKDISVRDGQLAGAWSNDARDLFGNYLVAHHVISDGELAMTLATMSHYGGKIGDTLVGLGLLDRVGVFRQLTRHTREKVLDLCLWTTGQYTWHAGNEDPRDSFPLEVDGFSVLGEAASRLGRKMIEGWITRHRDERLVPVRQPPVTAAAFELRGTTELLAELDGVRTIARLVQRHANPEHQLHAGRVLYLLHACELVRPT